MSIGNASLLLVLAVATLLRLLHLDRHSLWYDEVVSMRLARAPGPRALFALLFQIDATRAPLHPLLLQGWLRLFGPSELAGRSFSALCGILTVLVIDRLGRDLLDARTGRWAAWLAAISPALVRYSQEVRMYAWFVLVTCLSWWLLIRLRRASGRGRLAALVITQVAMAYSHPLGLLMLATQAGVVLVLRRSFPVSVRSWMLSGLAVGLAIAPWLWNYLNHPPESTSGRLPIRFLFGLPIEFVGGDSRALLLCLALVAFGVYAGGRAGMTTNVILLAWFAIPPLTLYVISRIGPSIFGPARYNLYVAPAYLLLLARGIAALKWRYARLGVAVASLILALPMIDATVYAPDLKADWRAAAHYLGTFLPESTVKVVVVSADPARNVEVETARYYLDDRIEVLPLDDVIIVLGPDPDRDPKGLFFFAVGVRGGRPVARVQVPKGKEWLFERPDPIRFDGLHLLPTGLASIRRRS